MIDISLNTEQIIERLSMAVGRQKASSALATAINNTASEIRKDIFNTVQKRYYLKKSGFNRNVMTLTRASPKKLSALLLTKGKPTPVISFRTSPSKPNNGSNNEVKATIIRDNGQKSILVNGLKSFVQRMPNSGHVGVFVRTGRVKMIKSKAKKPRKKLVRYYPIREIYSVGASSMVYGSLDTREQREILEQIRQQAYEGLERQIRLAVSRLTER